MIFQQIEKRRQEVQAAYEQAKRQKEIENQQKLETIRQQSDLGFITNQLPQFQQEQGAVEDSQPRKSRKSKKSSKRARIAGDVDALRNLVQTEVEKYKQMFEQKAIEIDQAKQAKQDEVRSQNLSDEDKQRLLEEIEAQAAAEQQELETAQTQELWGHFKSMGIDEQTVEALLAS